MYDLPAELNIDDIIGSEINQIGIGRYDVQFHFDSGRYICCQSPVVVMKDDELMSSWSEECGWTTTAFSILLKSPVASYCVEPRQLTIRLSSGVSLCLQATSDQYECIQIYPEGYIF